jgi:hypothetical protein
MQVQMINGNHVVSVYPDLIDNKYRATAKINVILPTTVSLQFDGKNANFDTITDAHGNITDDLYVKILAIKLDGFAIAETFLHQRLELHTTDKQTFVTSFIGFNGTMTIDLIKPSAFSQLLYFANYSNYRHND